MKIITVSDSPNLYSGLARVHRHILDGLMDAGHSVLPCVWFGYDNFTMERIKQKQITPPPLVYKTTGGDSVQMLTFPKRKNFEEVKMLYEVMKAAGPAVVLTHGDYWDFYYMKMLKSKLDFSFKWVAYLTMEREGVDKDLAEVLKYADVLATPTLFGQRTLLEATGRQVHYVPYGVAPEFTPATPEERARLRKERGCSDKFRFITVAQNTWRKNLPCLFQAIQILKKRATFDRSMEFYIHSNIDSADAQEASLYNLREIVKYLDIEDVVRFPQDTVSLFGSPSDKKLIEEYQASDMFILPSICEGYGLPMHEAMACGLPVIASNWSVMPETLGGTMPGPTDRGWLVDTRLDFVPPARPIMVPTPKALAEGIGGWGHHQPLLKSMSENCMKFAKGRRWEEMKRKVCSLVEVAAQAPAKLPVEEV